MHYAVNCIRSLWLSFFIETEFISLQAGKDTGLGDPDALGK